MCETEIFGFGVSERKVREERKRDIVSKERKKCEKIEKLSMRKKFSLKN